MVSWVCGEMGRGELRGWGEYVEEIEGEDE